MSLTSLIDVIFLLLLFFMLTSTFTRFSEIQLAAAGAGAAAPTDTPPIFLRLDMERITVNAESVDLAEIQDVLSARAEGPTDVLISTTTEVTSQRLVDLLVAIGSDPDLTVTVLE
ncbi:biopolymer transporter ExbD [Gymnodinialimonas sp. 2305UL16-5]|uniref:biopolymer transporter ExbD n=1 Tax=Gymnodinialimonas mytili TaxID=3126503 RepID=UPI00309BA828